ncbi:MAG: T9SS type A sorting domain-containing protein [Melioribacteraceae bacterium]|nr:T9SS type A sorting domain-containing protein [Melioribacteraceae bacterium]
MKKLFLTLFLPILLFAQRDITTSQLDAWNSFNESTGNSWSIIWNTESGSGKVLHGPGIIISGSNLGEMTQTFFYQNKDLFSFRPDQDNIELKKQLDYSKFSKVVFQQYYKGIPVYSSGITANFRNGLLFHFGNHFKKDIDLDVNPTISEKASISIAENFLNINAELEDATSSLFIFSIKDQYHLAYRVLLNFGINASYEIFVNAVTGEIVHSNDLIIPYGGTVNQYPEDPVNSSLVTGQSISFLDASGYLSGDFADVTYNQGYSLLYNRYRNFQVVPSNIHFDEGNSYYHVTKFAYDLFYDTLDYSDLYQNPISININTGIGASYSPLSHAMTLAIGDTTSPELGTYYRNAARKNDVMYHEYVHAVLWDAGFVYNTDESKARHEGYADYFTASFTDDPEIGEWFAYDAAFMRTCSNSHSTFNYGNWNNISYNDAYNLTQHKNGMIWSGALWYLRYYLGEIIANDIIFNGFLLDTNQLDFEEAVDCMISYDNTVYSGSHVSTIESVFNSRNVIDPNYPAGLTYSGSQGSHPTISWNRSNEPDVSGYKLYKSMFGTNYSLIFTTNKNYLTSYIDSLVTIGSPNDPNVYYKVRAFDSHDNESELSPVMTIHDGGISKDTSPFLEKIEFKLNNAFPNPFNPSTTIHFTIPEKCRVTLTVHNLLGEKVSIVYEGIVEKGMHSTHFNAKGLPSGIYFYRILAYNEITGRSYSDSKKMILLK